MNNTFFGGDFSKPSVSAIQVLIDIKVQGRTRLNVEFAVGVAALTAFEVSFITFDSTTAQTRPMVVANVATDYTAPAVNDPVRGASDDLMVATVGNHWLVIDCTGVDKVRLRASGTASTVVGTYGAA
jgi:hypothetical protein